MMDTSPHRDAYDADADEADVARPPLSTRAKVMIGIGLAALIAISSFYGWRYATVPVRWQEVGFTVTFLTETTIVFDVYLYTDQTVDCDLQALNRSYLEVGVARIEVDPAAGNEQRLTHDIATVEEATTAI